MLRKIIVNIFLLIPCISFSQKEIVDVIPEIKVIGLVKNNSIVLRWAVTTPEAWLITNKNGYLIERTTIVKNGNIVSNPQAKKLTLEPIKPKPLSSWESFTETNDNAAIAAQALFGESFSVEMNQENSMISILNQAEELQQRFSFALLAADQNFEVAQFSGLAFIDENVKEKDKYLYTVKLASSLEKEPIKSGGVFLGLDDAVKLPKPQELIAIFKDKATLLSWNFEVLKRYYNNYILERSDDNGKTFKKLTKAPIVSFSNKGKTATNRIFYTDSLAVNKKTYMYRVKGTSPFGIEGPYSDIVSGKGIESLKATPFFTNVVYNKKETIVKWEFPITSLGQISHFQLLKSKTPQGTYTVAVPKLDKSIRNYQLKETEGVSYYKIVAIGNDKSIHSSFPQMVQPEDKTPPLHPINLEGSIDSLGVVRVKWKKNTETDFLGYRVFRSDNENQEFTQRTVAPIISNYMVDTVNLKRLNKYILYKIQAFDRHYNPSKYSEVLKIRLPDVIPPTPPVLTNYKVNKSNVIIDWIASGSDDAESTLIYKKLKGVTSLWEEVVVVSLPENNFKDSNVINGTYLYTMLTKDSSGNESELLKPFEVMVENTVTPKIDYFKGTVDRDNRLIRLSWSCKASSISSIILYKAKKGEKPTRYKMFSEKSEKYVDKNLVVNTEYEYSLQVVLNSGYKSQLKMIKLKY